MPQAKKRAVPEVQRASYLPCLRRWPALKMSAHEVYRWLCPHGGDDQRLLCG